MTNEEVFRCIQDVPDFPKKGIIFKDITPVLANPKAFSQLIEALAEQIPTEIDKIVAIESRGFILGSALATRLHKGLVLVRKPGKLPRTTLSHSYELEYGQDTLQIHSEDLSTGEKVAIIDDVLATGGTASAAEHLCQSIGAEVKASVFMLEIEFLKGREKLQAETRSLYKI